MWLLGQDYTPVEQKSSNYLEHTRLYAPILWTNKDLLLPPQIVRAMNLWGIRSFAEQLVRHIPVELIRHIPVEHKMTNLQGCDTTVSLQNIRALT